MKFNVIYHNELLINLSMLGKGHGPFGNIRLRPMKSTNILHFPNDFLTITMFSNHIGYFIYLVNVSSNNSLISSSTNCFISSTILRFFRINDLIEV